MKEMRKVKIKLWLTRRIPRKFLYWIAVRIGAIVTIGEYSNTIVTELTFIEILNRLDNNKAMQ